MTLNLKGTATEKNLETALNGEALAHLKYQFYRSKLANISKEYEQILDEIIHNEKEHGKIWFKQLHKGTIPTDEMNLIDAITGELYECHELYTNFSRIAREEGFEEIAELFENIAQIECHHAQTFKDIKDSLNNETTFKSINNEDIGWKCLNCGHIIKGKNAPVECPICKHPQKYFTKNIIK